jgi:predicted ferric reductase
VIWRVETWPIPDDISTWPAPDASSASTRETERKKVYSMLYTIAVVLLILWLLGLVTSYTLGGFIHILLVVALVMILINVIGGRRTL